MGMNFVALMRYGGPGGRIPQALDQLEAGSPPEVRALARLLHERGFALGDEGAAVWEFTHRRELRDPRLDRRPALPRTDAALCLPEGFLLTFGRDAVEVYHLLRWLFFLTDPDIRRAMLDACTCLGHLFGATDCVITSDFSPVVQAFRKGLGFDAALASAGPEDGERADLADLYQETPDGYVMQEITLPGGRVRTRYRDWDVGRPPPEGWQRATTWDSKGYWRFALAAEARHATAAVVPVTEPPRLPTEPDEGWWRASGEPDAMLDFLLKRDAVSRRKVLLWACACVRRVWPRLKTEPVRRAVEVAERFADELTTGQAAENAARAAASVKKGDRRANRAACLLARLCSATFPFPPGDVSEAVIDAVLGPQDDAAARTAERRAHADLLRDICRPGPPSPAVADPAWLAWNEGTVRRLAEGIYDERAFERLPVLADALEDAGCDDAEVLAHCRGPGPHARGCFVLDAILGKG